jgi:hypothetical protein
MDNPDPVAVAVLTPSTGICRMEYAQSLSRLVAYFAQVSVFDDGRPQTITTDAVIGSGIGENYERMVLRYLAAEEHHWTHFLSIEDDMLFAPDCLHRLIRHRLPIVGCNYSVNKGAPLRFTAVKTCMRDQIVTGPDSTGLEEAGLIPQGFTLIAREVFEAVPRPWFLNGYSTKSEKYVTQDYVFSQLARKAGFSLFVDHDASKRVEHVGPKRYTWEDAFRDQPEKEDSGNGNLSRVVRVGV